MTQKEILNSLIPIIKNDRSVTAALLMGSVANGTESGTSDLDLLLIGKVNKFETEMMEGILIEYLYTTYEDAVLKLEMNSMEVYHYLGSKILYDYDGKLISLMTKAYDKYKNFKSAVNDKDDIKHWLTSTRLKLSAALDERDELKANYITATNSWKAIEAVFAVNDIPTPPSGRLISELCKLNKVPGDRWFDNLFGWDMNLRIQTLLYIILWVLPIL